MVCLDQKLVSDEYLRCREGGNGKLNDYNHSESSCYMSSSSLSTVLRYFSFSLDGDTDGDQVGAGPGHAANMSARNNRSVQLLHLFCDRYSI